MDEIFRALNVFRTFSWESVRSAFDILLVSFIAYRILVLVRGTRAWRVVGGLLVFTLFLVASSILRLEAFHWMLDKATLLGPVALVILLLPELRQGLEQFGQIGFWPKPAYNDADRIEQHVVDEVVTACSRMAETRTGALVVIERANPVDDVIATGITVDAKVTAELLGSMFYGQNPLHDGAVVIRHDRVVAAACRLPLSEKMGYDPFMHMRHRAAVGISEQLDCVVVVVSEERGTISLVRDGQLSRVGITELRESLRGDLQKEERVSTPRLRRVISKRVQEEDVETRVS